MAKSATATAAKPGKNKSKATAAPTVNAKVKVFEPNVKVLRTIDISPTKCRLTDKFRGRSQPVAIESVHVLAEQLIKRQDQPIQVREVPNTDEYEVIFGNTRTRAGMEIVNGFTLLVGSEDKQKDVTFAPVPDFTLRAEVVEVDDDEAVLRNITENVHRVQTTDIDDANNQDMLRTEYSMSDAAITRLYGYAHQASVTQLKKLLTLPDSVQQRIHENNMTKQAGFILVEWVKKKGKVDSESNKCDPELCEAVLAKCKGGEDIGNIGSSEVADAIRAYEKETTPTATVVDPTTGTSTTVAADGTPVDTGTGRDSNNVPTPTPTVFPKTLAEFKKTLEEFAGYETVSAKTAEFCTMTINFLKGEIEKDVYYDWVSVNLA